MLRGIPPISPSTAANRKFIQIGAQWAEGPTQRHCADVRAGLAVSSHVAKVISSKGSPIVAPKPKMSDSLWPTRRIAKKADIDQMGLIFSFTTKLNYD
jgi:hypothetical protein